MTEQREQGSDVPGWTPRPRPDATVLQGTTVSLEPMNVDLHAADLHRAFVGHEWLWDYMPYGPFASAAEYHDWATASARAADPFYYVLRDRVTGRCGGVASYLNIVPQHGSIEVGNICFAPEIQRGRIATETMFLMMDWAFGVGYRRYEWKCNALNTPSRSAALRFGFAFEGVFRQHFVIKGRNRDTAWFSITDGEWPALRTAFQTWLADDNFDASGQQKQRLSDLTAPLRPDVAS